MSTSTTTSPSHLPAVAVIGGGVMGSTLITAMKVAGWPGGSITVANRGEEKRAALVEAHGIRATADAKEAVEGAGIVVLAVKPQQMADVLADIAEAIPAGALVLTVAAALPASFYEERLAAGTAVIRAMPNTPSLVGRGATSISPGAHATEEHLLLAEAMLRATGLVVRVPEDLIEAVTVVAGSAPAYFYAITEAITEAGVMHGLDRELSSLLAQQTFTGAAQLLAESGETPQELRRRVSSPGGVTLAALEAMTNAGLQGVISAGANAAVARTKEMSAQLAG
ncbi:pyrroline-5-carboxylate reductase [Demequina mangrovi]|uniref:Pyrroline-5-carboxylate reductase n=1 Tax=Demequina mangrovi TaxID=1043493 RepID=A0A1H6VXQ1_9MICO|nr:pyrroline-5-carboxylate reductase [Demequina mangrovi]SEJ09419.1 pyrroline-5-carboxylate reductase [Demequina mangrovi]